MKTPLEIQLALLRAPSLGPAAFFKIMEIFPDLNQILTMFPAELQQWGFKPETIDYLKNPDWVGVEKDLRWVEQSGNRIITWQDPQYPSLLKQIPNFPPILYIKGNLQALSTPQLAMVGSRNPTPAGAEIARKFAEELSLTQLTITSGLALGIDAESHKGALKAQGLTIAVLGTGLDNIYPRRHIKLAEQILEQNGVLISEFATGTQALAENFPRRNRIISGLSLGVLVVEAALKSGSLITAKFAVDQGREVFAIPGSIYNPLSKGCHALIRQGAKLVETTHDILEELGMLTKMVISKPGSGVSKKPLDKLYAKLVECVGFEATPVDTIIRLSNLAVDKVSAMLIFLELEGYITAVPGGYVRNI